MSNTHLAFGVNKEKQNMGDPCSFKLNNYINQFAPTIPEFPRPTVYLTVEQTLRSPRPFFKDLSFLISHLTPRSSTLNPFPLLGKY